MRARQPHHSDYHLKPCIIFDRPRVSLERSPHTAEGGREEGTHFLACSLSTLLALVLPGRPFSTSALVSCLVWVWVCVRCRFTEELARLVSESNAGTQVLEDAEREQWKVEITQVRASSSRRTGREGRAVVVVGPPDESRF